MQRWSALQRPESKRLIDRLLDRRTDERAWRRGAEGEEHVAAFLDRRLPFGWFVAHDITIGMQGANLDHLLIGPTGVFTVNTKNLTGNVTVCDRAVLHNGRKTHYFGAALREAEIVSERLTVASSWSIRVLPAVVILGARVRYRGRPDAVFVADEYDFLDSLLERRPVMSDEAVVALTRLARSPTTWGVMRRPT
jgi:hypothetical protein